MQGVRKKICSRGSRLCFSSMSQTMQRVRLIAARRLFKDRCWTFSIKGMLTGVDQRRLLRTVTLFG